MHTSLKNKIIVLTCTVSPPSPAGPGPGRTAPAWGLPDLRVTKMKLNSYFYGKRRCIGLTDDIVQVLEVCQVGDGVLKVTKIIIKELFSLHQPNKKNRISQLIWS